MLDAGVDSSLGALPLVRSLVSGVDVDRLEVPEAVRVVEECAQVERLCAALRVVVTATLENKSVWRRDGARSLAAWMAGKTGTTVGSAKASLEMAGLLGDLRALAMAFRDGLLSEVQAREIAEVASEVPDAQDQLVEAAGKLSLRGLQEECQRVEAAALIDEDDRYRRVHKERRIRGWVRRGAGHLSAVMTPDELARVMAEINSLTDGIVVDAIRGGWFESREAHSVDALVDLIRSDRSGAPGPETMVHVVVGYDATSTGTSKATTATPSTAPG
jgi:hypothetical protein